MINFFVLFFAVVHSVSFLHATSVAFFGASLTQQKAPDGYVSQFKKIHGVDETFQFGYGGMYIDTAGLCFLDDVLSKKPTYVVLDWSVPRNPTGEFDENRVRESVKAIIYKITRAGSTPIFVHFRRTDGLTRTIDVIDSLKDELNVTVINMLPIFSDKALSTLLLRDCCHTNEFGGVAYSSYIHGYMMTNSIRKPNIPDEIHKYERIQKKSLQADVWKKLSFSLHGELIGIHMRIGRYSNKVRVLLNGEHYKDFQLWDIWCHYERPTVLLHISELKIMTKVDIVLLKEEIDRSQCAREISQEEWSRHTPCMPVYEFFHTGEICDIKVDSE